MTVTVAPDVPGTMDRQRHTMDFLRSLRAPARSAGDATIAVEPGFYWVRLLTGPTPSSVVAERKGEAWLVGGRPVSPKRLAVLSSRLEPPEPAHKPLLSAETTAALYETAIVGSRERTGMGFFIKEWLAPMRHAPDAEQADAAYQIPREG